MKILATGVFVLLLSWLLAPMVEHSYYEVRLLFKGDEIARCQHQFGSYFTVGHNVICRDIYR